MLVLSGLKNEVQINIKKGSLIPPDVDISQVMSEMIESPAMVLKGEVILRLSKIYRGIVYLLKVENREDNSNGEMLAGRKRENQTIEIPGYTRN